MLNRLLELTYNWRLKHGIYIISELQIGGHCGLCGAWMPDIIVPKDWAWDMCDDHISDEVREALIQARKDVAEGKIVPLSSFRK